MIVEQPLTGPVTTTDFPEGGVITNETYGTLFVGSIPGSGKAYFNLETGVQVTPGGSDICTLHPNAKVIL